MRTDAVKNNGVNPQFGKHGVDKRTVTPLYAEMKGIVQHLNSHKTTKKLNVRYEVVNSSVFARGTKITGFWGKTIGKIFGRFEDASVHTTTYGKDNNGEASVELKDVFKTLREKFPKKTK